MAARTPNWSMQCSNSILRACTHAVSQNPAVLRLRSPALRASLSGLGCALFFNKAFALLAEETGGHECLVDLTIPLCRCLVLTALRDSTFCSGDEGLDRCVNAC